MNKLIAVLMVFSSLASHAEWGVTRPGQKFWQPIALGLGSILRAQQAYSQQIHETAQRLQRQERTLQWLPISTKVERPADDLPILGWPPQSLQEDAEPLPSEIERLNAEKQSLEKWHKEGLLSKAEEHRLDFCRRQLALFFQAEATDASDIFFDARFSGLSNLPGICQLVVTPEEAAAAFPGILFLPDTPLPAAATDKPEDTYWIEEIVGCGTFGTIFRVTRTHDRQQFVAKVVTPQCPGNLRYYHFNNEVECLNRCAHFAIIRLFTSQKSSCQNYGLLITDFANAGDLHKRIKALAYAKTNFSDGECGHTIAQLILAMHHVHQNNILHCDIKPENVFLTDRGIVKLGDFGLAKRYPDVSQTMPTVVRGTIQYLPPELWAMNPTRSNKADIWSLGILFYEIVALRRPFLMETQMELRDLVSAGNYVPLPETCNPGLIELIDSMMQQTPNLRPSTEQLLQYPYVRKLIDEFKAYVSNPALFGDDPSESARILRDIDSVMPADAVATPVAAKPALRSARVMEVTGGSWKTCFVLLNKASISIGPTLEMNADESKNYPLSGIEKFTARGTYILAIYFKSSTEQILLQFDTFKERDDWVETLTAEQITHLPH